MQAEKYARQIAPRPEKKIPNPHECTNARRHDVPNMQDRQRNSMQSAKWTKSASGHGGNKTKKKSIDRQRSAYRFPPTRLLRPPRTPRLHADDGEDTQEHVSVMLRPAGRRRRRKVVSTPRGCRRWTASAYPSTWDHGGIQRSGGAGRGVQKAMAESGQGRDAAERDAPVDHFLMPAGSWIECIPRTTADDGEASQERMGVVLRAVAAKWRWTASAYPSTRDHGGIRRHGERAQYPGSGGESVKAEVRGRVLRPPRAPHLHADDGKGIQEGVGLVLKAAARRRRRKVVSTPRWCKRCTASAYSATIAHRASRSSGGAGRGVEEAVEGVAKAESRKGAVERVGSGGGGMPGKTLSRDDTGGDGSRWRSETEKDDAAKWRYTRTKAGAKTARWTVRVAVCRRGKVGGRRGELESMQKPSANAARFWRVYRPSTGGGRGSASVKGGGEAGERSRRGRRRSKADAVVGSSRTKQIDWGVVVPAYSLRSRDAGRF
ncbi:hypothetical protein C8F04DRAFT_1193100 [Mycena alexandri]|uniref:Uncharacterized protein n=1 Tax=Mycena alexandri TaxID=1745969 RepID=A0AAD6SA51_9AGAR|nr:hypothetical protein C8F04DRAFT_1193100 [Mycena alexandri]